jgi:hypothetical protein
LSYNITGFRVKKKKMSLIIPPDLIKKYFKSKENKEAFVEDDGSWSFNEGGEGVMLTGHKTGGNYVVGSFECYGEGSGNAWADIGEPLLRELAARDKKVGGRYTQRFEATIVWEGGDSIETVKVADGKYEEHSDDEDEDEEEDEKEEEGEEEDEDVDEEPPKKITTDFIKGKISDWLKEEDIPLTCSWKRASKKKVDGRVVRRFLPIGWAWPIALNVYTNEDDTKILGHEFEAQPVPGKPLEYLTDSGKPYKLFGEGKEEDITQEMVDEAYDQIGEGFFDDYNPLWKRGPTGKWVNREKSDPSWISEWEALCKKVEKEIGEDLNEFEGEWDERPLDAKWLNEHGFAKFFREWHDKTKNKEDEEEGDKKGAIPGITLTAVSENSDVTASIQNDTAAFRDFVVTFRLPKGVRVKFGSTFHSLGVGPHKISTLHVSVKGKPDEEPVIVVVEAKDDDCPSCDTLRYPIAIENFEDEEEEEEDEEGDEEDLADKSYDEEDLAEKLRKVDEETPKKITTEYIKSKIPEWLAEEDIPLTCDWERSWKGRNTAGYIERKFSPPGFDEAKKYGTGIQLHVYTNKEDTEIVGHEFEALPVFGHPLKFLTKTGVPYKSFDPSGEVLDWDETPIDYVEDVKKSEPFFRSYWPPVSKKNEWQAKVEKAGRALPSIYRRSSSSAGGRMTMVSEYTPSASLEMAEAKMSVKDFTDLLNRGGFAGFYRDWDRAFDARKEKEDAKEKEVEEGAKKERAKKTYPPLTESFVGKAFERIGESFFDDYYPPDEWKAEWKSLCAKVEKEVGMDPGAYENEVCNTDDLDKFSDWLNKHGFAKFFRNWYEYHTEEDVEEDEEDGEEEDEDDEEDEVEKEEGTLLCPDCKKPIADEDHTVKCDDCGKRICDDCWSDHEHTPEEMGKSPSDFYFAVCKGEHEDPPVDTFVVVSKNYWKRNKCLDDSGGRADHVLPDGFVEVMESEYEYDGDTEAGREKLLKLGFVYNPDLCMDLEGVPYLKDPIGKVEEPEKKTPEEVIEEAEEVVKGDMLEYAQEWEDLKKEVVGAVSDKAGLWTAAATRRSIPHGVQTRASVVKATRLVHEIDEKIAAAKKRDPHGLIGPLEGLRSKLSSTSAKPENLDKLRDLKKGFEDLIARAEVEAGTDAKVVMTIAPPCVAGIDGMIKEAEASSGTLSTGTTASFAEPEAPKFMPEDRVRVTKTGYYRGEWIESDLETAKKENPEFWLSEGVTGVVTEVQGSWWAKGLRDEYENPAYSKTRYGIKLDYPEVLSLNPDHETGGVPNEWLEAVDVAKPVVEEPKVRPTGDSREISMAWKVPVSKDPAKYKELRDARVFSIEGRVYSAEFVEGDVVLNELDISRRPFLLRVQIPDSKCHADFKAIMDRLAVSVRVTEEVGTPFVLEGEPEKLFQAIRTWGMKNNDCVAFIVQLTEVPNEVPVPDIILEPISGLSYPVEPEVPVTVTKTELGAFRKGSVVKFAKDYPISDAHMWKEFGKAVPKGKPAIVVDINSSGTLDLDVPLNAREIVVPVLMRDSVGGIFKAVPREYVTDFTLEDLDGFIKDLKSAARVDGTLKDLLDTWKSVRTKCWPMGTPAPVIAGPAPPVSPGPIGVACKHPRAIREPHKDLGSGYHVIRCPDCGWQTTVSGPLPEEVKPEVAPAVALPSPVTPAPATLTPEARVTPVPPGKVASVKVTLKKGADTGTMFFEEGKEFFPPNFMDMRFKPEYFVVSGTDAHSVIIGSWVYRVELEFTVGQEVKGYTMTAGKKKLRFLSTYSAYKVVGIEIDSVIGTSLTPVAPPPEFCPVCASPMKGWTCKKCGSGIIPPATPPVVPPAPPLEEAVEEEEEGFTIKKITPDTLKESKVKAIALKYDSYAERAREQGFVKVEVDSMDFPDHTMMYGTVKAVERRLNDAGKFYGGWAFVTEPTTGGTEWHIPYKDLATKAKKVTVAVSSDTDLQDVDVWEFPGPTRVDIGRLEKAVRVLGPHVKFRVSGAKDSVVIVEADDMAVAISPASFLKSKGASSAASLSTGSTAPVIPDNVKLDLMQMAGYGTSALGSGFSFARGEEEMKDDGFEFKAFTPDELAGWGTLCGHGGKAFSPRVIDFLKKQGVKLVYAIANPAEKTVSSGTTEPGLDDKAGEKLEKMIDKAGGSWRYDNGSFESE